MPFDFVRLWWLCLLPLVLILWWWIGQQNGGPATQVAIWRRKCSAILRLLTLLMLTLVLAGMRWKLPADRLTVTFLVDQSLSLRRQQAFIHDYLAKSLTYRPAQAQVAVVYFAGESSLELPATSAPYIPKSTTAIDREESNQATALQYGAAIQPPDQSGRLVLISDGKQTRGDLLQAAQMSALEIDCVAVPQDSQPEVLVEELRCPSTVAQKTPFDLVATLASKQSCPAQLELWRDGKAAGKFKVNLNSGKNVFLLPQSSEKTGIVSYKLRVSSDVDQEMANNVATGLTLVEGPSRIAFIYAGDTVPVLAEVLRASGLLVDTLTATQLPEDLGEWLSYQGVVLDNVASTSLTTEQLHSLATLVREAGLGFTMLGGVDSFAAGGYASTPLAAVVPLDMRRRRNLQTPPTVQLHILDKSGSMGEVSNGVEHMAMACEASIAAMELLTAEDQFGLIGFDDAYKWVVTLQAVAQPKVLARRIATLRAGGGTDLFPALEAGVRTLSKNLLSSRHILVLSDGATSPANFEHLTQEAVKQRITISTVAVGGDADFVFLEKLAREGKGRCYRADDIQSLPRIFARETLLSSGNAFEEKPVGLKTVASHVILQGVNLSALLLGHNLSTAKGSPDQVLLATQNGDPLLAVGRCGLGKTVAYTGDDGRLWSSHLAAQSDFSRLLLQAVRWSLPAWKQGPLEVSAGLDRWQRLSVRARVAPELAPQGLVGALLSPEGKSTVLDLVQKAPDRYECSAEFQGSGTFVVTVNSPDGSLCSLQPVALRRSKELSGGDTEEGLLRKVSELSGGRYQPAPGEVFRLPRHGLNYYRDLQDLLLRGCLLLLLVEIAVRRLPWPQLAERAEGPAPALAVMIADPSLLVQKVRRSPKRSELSLDRLSSEVEKPDVIRHGAANTEETLEHLLKVRAQIRSKKKD